MATTTTPVPATAAVKAPGATRASTAVRTWRIVAEGDAFAVYHGTRRTAWGLRTRAAAERWVARLGGAPPLDLAATRQGAARVWWGEDDR